MERKIIEALDSILSDSVRDRKVREIVLDNIQIHQHDHWYIVRLFGSLVEIYCNRSDWAIERLTENLLNKSGVWAMAKKSIKDDYRQKALEA